MRPSFVLSCALLAAPVASIAGPTFDFDRTPAGTVLPLTLTSDGVSARFSGNGSIQDLGRAPIFDALDGHVLIQNPFVGPVGIAFSADLSALSFDFSNLGLPSSIAVRLLDDGIDVGVRRFSPGMIPGFNNSEGFAHITGAVFDAIVVTSSGLLAFDHFEAALLPSAVPEPSTMALIFGGFAGLVVRRFRRADKKRAGGLPLAAMNVPAAFSAPTTRARERHASSQ